MSMFDTLVLEFPLVVCTEMQKHTFQTKSLECSLGEYIISKEGRLLQVRKRYEKTGKKIWNEFLKWEEDEYELADTRVHDEEYHGILRFYGFRIPEDASSEFVTFRAKFTDGTVQEITKEQDEPQASKM